MRIEPEIRLDFKDVLIRPKRSTLASRSAVDITRTFTFKHSKKLWTGVPIIAANMDTVGTFEMFDSLKNQQMMTALHKHYSVDELVEHFGCGSKLYESQNMANFYREFEESQKLSGASSLSFYSMGISREDREKFHKVQEKFRELYGIHEWTQLYNPLKMVCVDVANGYTEAFVEFISKLREDYSHITIMAGNVVTADMTEALILAGADIVKVGIGPGSVCTTRKMTGVGYPQLSAIIECADAAHGLGGLICADGGCTVPGDIAKAFGAGADFVMLGGLLAGHTQSGGELVEVNGQQFKRFYGMSSDTAMNIHNGGVASYRASEGKTVDVPYRGDVAGTIQGILGGIRSAMTYIGASSLKEVPKRTTFIRVSQQLNEIFGKS